MELRVLGAHNLESRHTRMESHLIDGQLALDAGSLTRSLSFGEQEGIRAVLLSHRHFDHVRDLLPLGMALREVDEAVKVHAIPDTIDFVGRKLLDGSLYPNFVNPDPPREPSFTLVPVEFYKEFSVLDYTVKAVPVPHAVPAAGYLISSGDVSLFYTGDAGEGVEAAWEHVCPDVLLTECTYGNDGASSATRAGHLIPGTVGERPGGISRQVVAPTARDRIPHQPALGAYGAPRVGRRRGASRHPHRGFVRRHELLAMTASPYTKFQFHPRSARL